jgi:hypothetical protein
MAKMRKEIRPGRTIRMVRVPEPIPALTSPWAIGRTPVELLEAQVRIGGAARSIAAAGRTTARFKGVACAMRQVASHIHANWLNRSSRFS